MTASELIEQLEALIDQHGDCICTFDNQKLVGEIRTYDADGMIDGTVVEFCLLEGTNT